MASIHNQLTKIAVTKMKTGAGETYAEILKREVDRLYDCIQERINEYYASYDPIVYKRTDRFRYALYAEDLVDVRINENQIELSLRFHPALAYHDTWTEKGNGFIPILLNYGFHNEALKAYINRGRKDGEPKIDVEHLTYLEPQLFIENGILDWNRQNKLGIQIDVVALYNGKFFSYF